MFKELRHFKFQVHEVLLGLAELSIHVCE